MIARTLLGFIAVIGTMSAALICPTIANTNNDCGVIVTISTSSPAAMSLVPDAAYYGGSDDLLIGITNLSRATFSGSFPITDPDDDGRRFSFDGEGICTFTHLAYCSTTATGYEGPIMNHTGTINMIGLAAGAATYFSLESASATINGGASPTISGGNDPLEPATSVLLLGVLGVGFAYASERLRSAAPQYGNLGALVKPAGERPTQSRAGGVFAASDSLVIAVSHRRAASSAVRSQLPRIAAAS